MRLATTASMFCLLAGAAAAQGNGGAGMVPSDLAQTAGSAVDALRSAAEDKLLIGDVIGSDVSGPSGETIGTIRNLVAVPGGRLVAVVLELEGGDRIAAPYQLLKVSAASGSLQAAMPVTADELTSMSAVEEMSGMLGL